MKTLQEIIERNDYKNVNKALKIRCDELANIFAKKWDELELPIWDSGEREDYISKDITVNNRTYTVKWNTYYDNFDRYKDGFMFVRVTENYDSWTPHCIHSDNEYMDQASDSILVNFLNDANDIVQEFDRIESAKVEKINNALNKCKNI